MPLLAILAWSGLFTSIGESRGIWVLAEEKMQYVKYYCAISAVCSIALNSAGVAVLGMRGAAIAALITGLIQALIAPLLFPGTRAFTRQYLAAFTKIPTLISLVKERLKHGK